MDSRLAELTCQEEELMRSVAGLTGTMEAKHETLLATGVYMRYADIHATYAELATEQEEALKRAIFLQWYAWSEPECFTGVFLDSLHQTATTQAELLLQNRVETGQLDQEWRWMLPYYYRLTEYAFGSWTTKPAFTELLAALPEPTWTPHPVLLPLETRGRLGRYWCHIQASYAHFRKLSLQ